MGSCKLTIFDFEPSPECYADAMRAAKAHAGSLGDYARSLVSSGAATGVILGLPFSRPPASAPDLGVMPTSATTAQFPVSSRNTPTAPAFADTHSRANGGQGRAIFSERETFIGDERKAGW